MFRTLLHGLLDLLAPPECPGCALPWSADAASPMDGSLPESPSAMDRAFRGEPDSAARSRSGGQPEPHGRISEAHFCPACAPLIEPAARVFAPPAREAAAHAFQGPLADAVRRFKYGGARHLGSSLGGLLVAAASVYAGQVDAVVPMPLHVRKLRQRGFNPSALLARPVASALSVPLRTRWLARRRATQDQAGLSSEQRQLNVHGAFAARPAPAQTILLIDDVRTTGATLTEAAATLKAHGHDVFTLALAWAPP